MGSYLRHVISWLLIHVTNIFVIGKLQFSVKFGFHHCYHCLLLIFLMSRYENFEGTQFSIFDADYFVFHSPYNKVCNVICLLYHM